MPRVTEAALALLPSNSTFCSAYVQRGEEGCLLNLLCRNHISTSPKLSEFSEDELLCYVIGSI